MVLKSRSLIWCLVACLMGGLHCVSTADERITRTYDGRIFGTTYHIITHGQSNRDISSSIDSLLAVIDFSTSTYKSSSIISQFNRADSCFYYDTSDEQYALNDHFKIVLEAAHLIYKQTEGAFDPSVGPLVDYWGFGKDKRKIENVDSAQVQQLLELVGFDKMHRQREKLCKVVGQQLDFSAIAKGYAVDVLVEWLQKIDINGALVEIGGETRTFGSKMNGDPWVLGVNSPSEEAALSDLLMRISIGNHAVATSGNYRNYYEVDGRKFVHTIDPTSGFTHESTLLSATIVHESCMFADAYATACMAVGLDVAIALLSTIEDVDALLISSDENGDYSLYKTEGFDKYIVQ